MLNKDIASRLRAGTLVLLVEESDELLALQAAKLAAQQFQPVTVLSAADGEIIPKIEQHKGQEGTLIVSDLLRVYGENPVVVRLVREVALQQKPDGKPFSRMIMLEVPGVTVPPSLKSDIDYLIPKMPGIKELRSELDDFIESNDIKLGGNGEERHAIAAAVAGLARHEAARLFARCQIERKTLDAVWLRKEKASRVAERLGGALTFVEADVPDVGGLDGLNGWLDSRQAAFGSEAAKKFGLPEPKGVLLLGIPGTGKSLTAKTVAKKWGLPLLRLDAGRLFGSLVGQSEANTRQAIDAAEACAPCIVWVDEIEKGLSSGGLDGGTSQRVFGTLLTWLQDKTAPVFVVATANRIAALPPELLRKGRFDEIFFVDLPMQDEREEILTIHLNRHGRDPKRFKVKELAGVMEGYSGAELEQAIIDGMFAAYALKRDVTAQDVMTAAQGTKPLSQTMAEDVRAMRTWAQGRAKMASVAALGAVGDGGRPRRAPVAA